MAQVKQKRIEVQNILIMLLSNMGIDTPENIEEIVQFVFEDVCECADPVKWHSGDVAKDFRRWIEAQAMSDKLEQNDKLKRFVLMVLIFLHINVRVSVTNLILLVNSGL